LPTHAIKPRVGKLKTRVGKQNKFFGTLRRIFSKNLCPPWPESVPAPLLKMYPFHNYLLPSELLLWTMN